MGSYKLRKVPANWEHPKDNNGNFIPLLDRSYSNYLHQFQEERDMWNKGFESDLEIIDNKWVEKYIPKKPENVGITFEEHAGEERSPECYRPDWTEEEQTHFQMYEDVTEGTPVSPVFEKVVDLARWLANELNDDRYPYTSVRWLKILKGREPFVGIVIEIPLMLARITK